MSKTILTHQYLKPGEYMRNNIIIKLAVITIASCLNSACSKDRRTVQSKTHGEFIDETLKSPLCEITSVSFENGKNCKIRLQHTFDKTGENSYTVSTSSLDDCVDLSFNTLQSNQRMKTAATKANLNENLFNENAIYYVEFSPNRLSADFIHSSQASKVKILRSYSTSLISFITEESESDETTFLDKNFCDGTNPEIDDFCFSYNLDYLGRRATTLSSSDKEQLRVTIYNLLFKNNLCGIDNRAALYNAFLSEGEYL